MMMERRLVAKDDPAVPVHEHAVGEKPAHAARERQPFAIPPQPDEILRVWRKVLHCA